MLDFRREPIPSRISPPPPVAEAIPVHRFSQILALLVLASPAALAQTTIGPGEVVLLPRILGGCDHATVAVNSRGDIFVTWNSAATVSGRNTKQIEGVLVPMVSSYRWQVPDTSDVVLLGDPGLGLSGGVDKCHKPDVAAVGRNFLVTWPRIHTADRTASLEVAVIRVSASGTMTVDVPAPGQGYVVDPDFRSGLAGGMPDLARLSYNPANPGDPLSDHGVVAYAHEIEDSGSFNAYDIRAATIHTRKSPPVIGGPAELVRGLAVDSTGSYPTGGRVLPDIVEDDEGKLVLAYEEFIDKVRFGSSKDRGRIVVKRFEWAAPHLVEVDSIALYGDLKHNRQRRPNLSASHADFDNTVSIAWPEMDENGDQPSTHFGVLDFTSGAAVYTDIGFPNVPGAEELRPVPLQGLQLRTAVAEILSPTEHKFSFVSLWPVPAFRDLPTGGLDPERPALDIVETENFKPGGRVVPVVFESWPAAVSVERIFLVPYVL